jgi:hypothetical protein
VDNSRCSDTQIGNLELVNKGEAINEKKTQLQLKPKGAEQEENRRRYPENSHFVAF